MPDDLSKIAYIAMLVYSTFFLKKKAQCILPKQLTLSTPPRALTHTAQTTNAANTAHAAHTAYTSRIGQVCKKRRGAASVDGELGQSNHCCH